MDGQLRVLIDLQGLDSRLAALEGERTRLPAQIEALRAAVAEVRKAVDTLRGKVDAAKKEARAKEKDLDVTQVKRQKSEARLYEVKTNKEYSAVLTEIEEIKQEKARVEEEILSLMELQERLSADIRETEGTLKAREAEAQKEEAAIRQRLAAVEAEVEVVRDDRTALSRELPRDLLAEYEKFLRHRGGLAVAQVLLLEGAGICGGCRMTLTPQRLQEVKQQSALLTCESCGRFLYWLLA